jgi:hypothetical protein
MQLNQWQLRVPKRPLNKLLFYVGWCGLAMHMVLMAYCGWIQLTYPVNWWFSILAPVLSILWGGVPALQIQSEQEPAKHARLDC